jgi:hypothetical protein
MLKGLLECMKEMPPTDFIAGAWAKSKAPKPIAQQAAALGKVKKGKVKKRG